MLTDILSEVVPYLFPLHMCTFMTVCREWYLTASKVVLIPTLNVTYPKILLLYSNGKSFVDKSHAVGCNCVMTQDEREAFCVYVQLLKLGSDISTGSRAATCITHNVNGFVMLNSLVLFIYAYYRSPSMPKKDRESSLHAACRCMHRHDITDVVFYNSPSQVGILSTILDCIISNNDTLMIQWLFASDEDITIVARDVSLCTRFLPMYGAVNYLIGKAREVDNPIMISYLRRVCKSDNNVA